VVRKTSVVGTSATIDNWKVWAPVPSSGRVAACTPRAPPAAP
jgi:hypothetical protein